MNTRLTNGRNLRSNVVAESLTASWLLWGLPARLGLAADHDIQGPLMSRWSNRAGTTLFIETAAA